MLTVMLRSTSRRRRVLSSIYTRSRLRNAPDRNHSIPWPAIDLRTSVRSGFDRIELTSEPFIHLIH